MLPKPKHLGPAYAAQFGDRSIVSAYRYRPPYPDETFDVLARLQASAGGAVLDAGCGTGDLARPLAARVRRVDAVDRSAPMIGLGRSLPGGDRENLRWIEASLEDAPLDLPYSLVVAGESLHWMEWEIVLPRLREALTSGGRLAIVGRLAHTDTWRDALIAVVQRFSTNRDFAPYDLVQELESRSLFKLEGTIDTAPVRFEQSLDEYIESWHSRNGLSRDRMAPSNAAEFDAQLREILLPHCAAGRISFDVGARVIWGIPAPDANDVS